jgi:hypothetical protein
MENPPEELIGLSKRLDSLTLAFMKQRPDFPEIDRSFEAVEREFLGKTADAKWSNAIKSAVADRKWYFPLETKQPIEFCELLFSRIDSSDKLMRGSRMLIAAQNYLARGESSHAAAQLESLIRELSPEDEWESIQLATATELLKEARNAT